MARVVDINVNRSQQSAVNRQRNNQSAESRQPLAIQDETGFRLTDGSILIFKPLAVKDDKLLGHSPICGVIAIPVESIQQLYFGDTAKSFKTPFEEWAVRPAKEPVSGENP